MSKIVKKTFLANDGFVAETYDIRFNLKKTEKICRIIGLENDISLILLNIILDDDMFDLSSDIHNLIECISPDNIKLFHRIFKIVRFCDSDKIFEPHLYKNDLFNSFNYMASAQQIKDIMNGRLDVLAKQGKSK